MPAPKTGLPEYLPLCAKSPRNTATPLARSSVATSTASSMLSMVVSSSALRKRGLAVVRRTAFPLRSARAAPRSSLPEA